LRIIIFYEGYRFSFNMNYTSRAYKLPDFKHFEDGQMFLCNSITERECLGRMLFGSPASKWNEVSKITNRTAIFLYTLGRYPMIRGIFVAQKPPFFDCSGPYKGKFPAQVSVRWYYKFHPMPSGYLEFDRIFGGDGNRERKLSKAQTQSMISGFIDHIWRTNVLAQLSTIRNPKCSQRKTVTRMKKKKQTDIQVTKAVPRPNCVPNFNVLLFDGKPIPVYNPRGVYPVMRALPPLQQRRVTTGFTIPRYFPQVNYFPQPRMTLHPMLGFQRAPMQMQMRAFTHQTRVYPPGRPRAGKKNVRLKSQ